MADKDKKIDPYDVAALEKSLNDSATRVSTIWVSFLIFSLYLVIAAGNVTHRQLFLEEPIKLPVLNIDLPLVGFFFLAPVLFVIFHLYVLIQVLLLARTAAAYNSAVDYIVTNDVYNSRVRQRLTNTLFAQLFAGSPREREGTLGLALRLMAWTTLIIGPVFVLLTFNVKFLPYHSHFITWAHRLLVALDFTAAFLIWPGVLDANRDISWRALARHRLAILICAIPFLTSVLAISFPGEFHAGYSRYLNESWSDQPARLEWPLGDCRGNSIVAGVLPANFDRLYLPNEDFVDDDRLSKLESATKAKGRKDYEGERTRNFRARNIRCGNFARTDLRRTDFTGADANGASFAGAELDGAALDNLLMTGVNMRDARLVEASLIGVEARGSSFESAQMRGAKLWSAEMQGANLSLADLSGADLNGAKFQASRLFGTKLVAADLSMVGLQGADLGMANLQGANLNLAQLQGASLIGADLRAARFHGAQLQGALLEDSNLQVAIVSRSFLWKTRGANCNLAQVTEPQFDTYFSVSVTITVGESNKEPFFYLNEVSDSFDKWVDELSIGMAETSTTDFVSVLRKRLLTSTTENVTEAERVWIDCSQTLPDGRIDWIKVASHLIGLSCTEGAQKRKVLDGITTNWMTYSDVWSAPLQFGEAMTRGLLGENGRKCPGTAELTDFRASLRASLDEIEKAIGRETSTGK